jgi:hypothetical protein
MFISYYASDQSSSSHITPSSYLVQQNEAYLQCTVQLILSPLIFLTDHLCSPPMLSPPYRGGGVWVHLRAIPAVAKLLVGPPRPDRSRGRSQTKRDTLVFQVGGWMFGWQPHTLKIKLFRNPEEGQGLQRAVLPVVMMMIIIYVQLQCRSILKVSADRKLHLGLMSLWLFPLSSV